jgi:hypothetical protein
MRSLLCSLGTVLLLGGLPALGLAQEQEPNDSCARAQDVSLEPELTTVAGRVAPADLDFYRFDAPPGVGASAAISDFFGVARLGVFDEQCRLLATADRFAFLDPRLEFNVPASGTFFVAAAERTDRTFAGLGRPVMAPYAFEVELGAPYVGSISGRVVDAATGAPLAGTTTAPVSVLLQECSSADGCRPAARQQPDALGRFRFAVSGDRRRITTGQFLVTASASEYRTTTSARLDVGPDQVVDFGDVTLPRQSVRFSELEPCADTPAQGGTCEYSVRIHNTTSEALSGTAWSFVVGPDFRAPFEASTGAIGSDVRRARVRIPPLASQRVTFRFAVPGLVDELAEICTDLRFGLDPSPFVYPERSENLFCLQKRSSRLTAVPTGE